MKELNFKGIFIRRLKNLGIKVSKKQRNHGLKFRIYLIKKNKVE